MTKSKEKNKAICLRKKGESIKDIAKILKISKGTVSVWCRDIKLKPDQVKRLHEKMVKGGYKGRMIGARAQYNRRIEKIKKWEIIGIKEIGKLSKRDLLIAGLALYWGEGSKKYRKVSLANSDPRIIKFFIKFLEKILNVKKESLTACIGINEIHKNRIKEVEHYWSKIIGIPKEQFTKTTLIKVKNKKNYSNFSVHYGTITIKVRKSADLYYRVMGLIEALK